MFRQQLIWNWLIAVSDTTSVLEQYVQIDFKLRSLNCDLLIFELQVVCENFYRLLTSTAKIYLLYLL